MSVATASYAATASTAISSSYALTASYTLNGSSGGGGNAQTFIRLTPAVTWSLNHNYNSYTPLVQVYDSGYNQLVPANIIGISSNTIEIHFALSSSGYAIVSTGGITISGSNATLNQAISSTTWSFEHGLNEKYPVFTIFDANDDVIIPLRIHAENAFTSSIYFSTPRTGTAVAANCGLGGVTFTSASYASTASYALTATSASHATSASYLNPIVSSYVVLTQVSQSLNFVDDTAAAAGGVPLGGLYRNGNFILIRIS